MKLWIGLLVGITLFGSDQSKPLYRLDRYFGGASQGELVLEQVPSVPTDMISVREEVFEAKEGRRFGGVSQGPIDRLILRYLDHNDTVETIMNHTVRYK